MFQFPGCPPARLWIHLAVSRHCPGRVSPFGYPRIVTCLQFPVAFRSLPRPSSAVGALASTLCSYSLDFFVASSPETNYSLRYELSLIILCNWSSFESSSSSLCSCQGAGPPACFRSPDPENDTGFLRFFERFRQLFLRLARPTLRFRSSVSAARGLRRFLPDAFASTDLVHKASFPSPRSLERR